MTDDMATLIAKKYIQRRDAKARQKPNGDYAPVAEWNGDGTRGALHPWMMSDLQDHLDGKQTFGHYLLDSDDMCKLFAFDIDLRENKPPTDRGPGFTGNYCVLPDLRDDEQELNDAEYMSRVGVYHCDPRVDWTNRAHPSRPWLKMQLRTLASRIARTVSEEFDLPVATAYSGSKGVHVYAFTGPIKASAAFEAGQTVLQLMGTFESLAGNNFYQHSDQTPFTGFPNMTIEIFPKQSSLQGKDLGNLMRLPLGRNLKSSDPTFFLDERAPMSVMAPHPDPIGLLESGNPWRD